MKGLRRALLGAIAVACIALQFGGSLGLSAIALALWLGALALAARPQLRRLWMPRFWIVSIIMALGSGLLLGKPDLDLGPIKASREGLEAGLLMVVRGLFLVALMGWVSKLIVDDDVQRGIRKLGLAQFGNALTAAFGLIPSLGERVKPALSAGRGSGFFARTKALRGLAVDLVVHTVQLARSLERVPLFIAAVVGPPGSGKTSLVHRVLERLRETGVRVGGVTQPAIDEAGARTGYRLRDAATGEEIAFAQRASEGFTFSEEGWAWAHARVAGALAQADCVAVDEVGRLESRGEGHLRTLAMPERAPTLLLAVREEFADPVAQRLGPFTLKVAPTADASSVDQFVSALCDHLRAVAKHSPSKEEVR